MVQVTYLTKLSIVLYDTLYIVGGVLTCKFAREERTWQRIKKVACLKTLFTISSIFPLSFKRMRLKRSTKDRKNGALYKLGAPMNIRECLKTDFMVLAGRLGLDRYDSTK